jgi:hypothetical protein
MRKRNGGFTGLPITRGGTRLDHLFFADDSLLFCKAKEDELTCILETLDLYEKASSQKLNKEKISIFFSRNTKAPIRELLSRRIGVHLHKNMRPI